jgi:hypothetical protein
VLFGHGEAEEMLEMAASLLLLFGLGEREEGGRVAGPGEEIGLSRSE